MELTAEMLEARRLELEQQKSSVLADLHAIDGALQQLTWTLEQLEKEVGPEEPASESP